MDYSTAFKTWVSGTLIAAGAGLTFAACTHLDPSPDSTVVMRVKGSLIRQSGASTQAVVEIRESVGALKFDLSVYDPAFDCPAGVPNPPSEADKEKCIVSYPEVHAGEGSFEAWSVKQLFAGSGSGVLVTDFDQERSKVTVTQHCELNKGIATASLAGTSKPVARGKIEFVGARSVEYSWGMLSRWEDGTLRLSFNDANGELVGRFEGETTREVKPLNKYLRTADRLHAHHKFAVGSRVAGKAEGPVTLGGTWFGGGNDAVVDIDLSSGGGAVDIGRDEASFSFDPHRHVKVLNDEGVKILTSTDSYVEISDAFEGKISVSSFDFNSGGEDDPEKKGFGSGYLNYSLSVAVTPDEVVTTAKITLKARAIVNQKKLYRRRDGSYRTTQDIVTFEGSKPQIQTQLDW